jgi:hypothetical protein
LGNALATGTRLENAVKFAVSSRDFVAKEQA